jgi:hypothetical protein
MGPEERNANSHTAHRSKGSLPVGGCMQATNENVFPTLGNPDGFHSVLVAVAAKPCRLSDKKTYITK